MTKRTPPAIIRVMSIGVIAMLVFAGAITKTQLHPPGNASAPLVIAVIADHYTAGQEQEFLYDAENFFLNGLLVDDYYKNYAGDVQIVTYFEPVAAGVGSNYGFSVGAAGGNCAVSWQADTMSKLEAVVNPPGGANTINPRHFVVIGNHPYNFGCTQGTWTYVAVDAVGTDVLQHEFGHVLADLFDEWALASNGSTPYPEIIPKTDLRNCFDLRNTPPPHWSALPGAGQIPGCDLYQTGIVHAFQDCRMGASHHATFCAVCKLNMDAAFLYERNPEWDNPNITNPNIQNPNVSNPNQARRGAHDEPHIIAAAFELQPPPKITLKPATARPIMRLVVSFDPAKFTLAVKSASFTIARYVPQYRRLGGQFVYEFTDAANTILEVGVLPGHLFEGRSYRGAAQQHQTAPPGAKDVVLLLPDLDEKTARDASRAITLQIYRLSPTVSATRITPNVLRDLKDSKTAERVAQATSDQIRGAL
jgi:hypothetical protein